MRKKQIHMMASTISGHGDIENRITIALGGFVYALRLKLIEKGFGALLARMTQYGESLFGLPGLDCRTAKKLVEHGHEDLVSEFCYRIEIDENFCGLAYALIARGKGSWVARLLKTMPENSRPIGVCAELCRNGFLGELVGSPNISLWYPDQMILAATEAKDAEGICSYILQIFSLKQEKKIYLSDATIQALSALCRSLKGSHLYDKMLSSLKTLLTMIPLRPIPQASIYHLIHLDAEIAQLVLSNPNHFTITDEKALIDAVISAGHKGLSWGLREGWSEEAKIYAARALIKAGIGDLLGEEHHPKTFDRLGGFALPVDVIEHLCLLGHAGNLSKRLAHASNVDPGIAISIMNLSEDGPRSVAARLFAVKKDGRAAVALEAFRKGGARVISPVMAEWMDSPSARMLLTELIRAEDIPAIMNWLIAFPSEDQNEAVMWLIENGKADLVVAIVSRLHDLSAETGLALCRTEYYVHFFPSQRELFLNLSDDQVVNELINCGCFSDVDNVFKRLKQPGPNGIPICFDLQKGAEIILKELSRVARNFDGFKNLSNDTAERLIHTGAARLVSQHLASFPNFVVRTEKH